MEKQTKQLIINADDFGLSPGVTSGILYAHRYGRVSSTTAMVNTPFAKQSLKQALEYPELGVGLHWVLDTGRPVFSHNSSLTDHTGMFLKGKTLIESAKKQDLKDELEAQLELIHQWYGKVTHIDSHHHMHLHIPSAIDVVTEVAEQHHLAIRTFSSMMTRDHVRSTDSLYFHFYGEENVSLENLLHLLSNLSTGTTEIMCHPAFMDIWLKDLSSYNDTRMRELDVLTTEKLKQFIVEESLELIHYGGVADGY